MTIRRSARLRPLVISSLRSLCWISWSGFVPFLSSWTSISRTSLLESVSYHLRLRETTPTALESLAIFSNSAIGTWRRVAGAAGGGAGPGGAAGGGGGGGGGGARGRAGRGARAGD